jgi:hypothetical protein
LSENYINALSNVYKEAKVVVLPPDEGASGSTGTVATAMTLFKNLIGTTPAQGSQDSPKL